MRPQWRWLMGLAATVMLAVPEAQAQFNPQGRKRPKPGGQQVAPPRRPAGAGTRVDTPARPPTTPAETTPGDPTKGPDSPSARPASSAEALIARYTAIALQQPGVAFPLQRLAELYRQRDGNLEALLAELRRRAEGNGTDHWSARLALAGIQHHDGQPEQAVATYRQAIAENPQHPAAHLALGQLLGVRGDRENARKELELALPQVKAGAESEQILRQLISLSLDLGDVPAAQKHHRQLVTQSKGSFYVQAELGRELLERGKYPEAVGELRELVKAASGDNRVLAPALRDLGAGLVRLGQRAEALETLRKALRVAGADAGVRREIYQSVVDLYRTEDRLAEFIKELEQQPNKDALVLRVLGSLYEETGQVDRALAAYQKALAGNPKNLEIRIKVVQLLQVQGELAKAILEYEALIRAAPRNPDFVFQLAEALIQRGERDKALAQLTQLENRSGADEQILAALADFYERLEEKGRAMELLKRLAQLGTQDPQHLVVLGERYWSEGDKARALQTWQRVRLAVTDRAVAELTLGEVFLEHGMTEEGLAAFLEAAKLGKGQPRFQKALAAALERAGATADNATARRDRYQEARKLWEDLLRTNGSDPVIAREARQHIVSLWMLGGDLTARVAPLEKRFSSTPPDLDSGRLLSEVYLKLKRWGPAQRTLERLVKLAPGDAASWAQLERALAQERKLRPAIEVLKRLVTLEPKRAREYWQRMAQYAAELYADNDAIEYSARAVELSPDDADGHRRLGQMYRRRQDVERAIQSFRQAISKNDRLFAAYLELAELLVGKGDLEEADRLLRRVVRACPDDEMVTQAARQSIQLNLGRGTLDVLERELLPVALGNPQKPLYRRLLVEVYGTMAFPLVYQTKGTDAAASSAARAKLQRLGERAVKPLLDALSDDRGDQKRTAIELLSHIRNRGAGPALLAFATGPAEPELRVRAMTAVGVLRDPALLPRLSDWLAASTASGADLSDPVVTAAAWALARMGSREARIPMLAMLSSDAPNLKALAAVGLGLGHESTAVAPIAALAQAASSGPLPLAAAAFALGELGARSQQATLLHLAESLDTTVRAQAVIALARLAPHSAARVISHGLVSSDPELQEAAAAAATVWATGQYHPLSEPLPAPDGPLDVRGTLRDLRPAGYTDEQRAQALVKLGPHLIEVTAAATRSSAEQARIVANALVSPRNGEGFGPLAWNHQYLTPATRDQALQVLGQLGSALVAPFVALSSHPSSEIRLQALQFLAARPEPGARSALIGLLQDADPNVRRAALDALVQSPDPSATHAVIRLLQGAPEWPLRVRAAQALVALGKDDEQGLAFAALSSAARRDADAWVREAALRSIGMLNAPRAQPVIRSAASQDPEPRVRETARRLLLDSEDARP